MRCTNICASATSWMLMTAASCRSAQISPISRMIWREVLGSRLAVGSSTSSSSGSCSSARAMPTRWRWPPESASARLSTCSVRPTRSSSCECLVDVGLREAAQERAPERDVAEPARQHVLHHGQALDQGELLEDHADAPARLAQTRRATGAVISRSPRKTWPEVGSTRRLTQRISVDLPAPDGPIRPTTSPAGDAET